MVQLQGLPPRVLQCCMFQKAVHGSGVAVVAGGPVDLNFEEARGQRGCHRGRGLLGIRPGDKSKLVGGESN